MHWIHLTDEGQVQNIIVRSQEKPQVIFKYSTKCNVSEAIFSHLQKECCPKHMDFHFLDLISHEDISTKISEKFHVAPESPQILLIKNGECVFEESHSEISLQEIMEHVTTIA
ncbi:MAG TPA: bacillithiol system redox-active protein YtxJ [Chitinophagaceae bacterium]